MKMLFIAAREAASDILEEAFRQFMDGVAFGVGALLWFLGTITPLVVIVAVVMMYRGCAS